MNENTEHFKNDIITNDNKCPNNNNNNENISKTKTIPLLILPSSVADSSNTNTAIIDCKQTITDNSNSILTVNDISDKISTKKKFVIKNSNNNNNISKSKLTEENINGTDNNHQLQVDIETKEIITTDLSESNNENDNNKSLLSTSTLPMIGKSKTSPEKQQSLISKVQDLSTVDNNNSENNSIEMKIEKMDNNENHCSNSFTSTNDTTMIDSISDLSLKDSNTILTNNGNLNLLSISNNEIFFLI